MRLRVLLAVFLVEFLSALPACSATSEIDVPAAEFFFGWARISGSAAATRYVCPAGKMCESDRFGRPQSLRRFGMGSIHRR
jgi:hypothetical protein